MKTLHLKHSLLLMVLMLLSHPIFALTIPAGTIYFDNTKTKYSNVQFVFGKESVAESYIHNMTTTNKEGLWKINFTSSVADMYRYTFSNTTLSTGRVNQSFPALKDYISNTINCNRTATREDPITAGYVFVPESGDNWAQGTWMSLTEWEKQQGGGATPSGPCSGTLPIVYIETQNHAAITSKEDYINASFYIDALNTGYDNFATKSTPLAMQIKGRGNYTWRDFDKKPYKIKFNDKYAVLGMPANKHWCLMAFADDDLGYLRNPVGFQISEYLNLLWTPHYVPVEVILNGQYWGLYFLTEHVRIGKNRLPIKELEDNCSNPDSITGGWLVEIDNYDENGNVSFTEGNGQFVMITPKSPEVLSPAERNYLTNQLSMLNSRLYGSSESQLQAILDFNEAAKFYLIQEILEDCESYHGSCFLYKDRDSTDTRGQKVFPRWHFGPVWDFGNAYDRHQERFIYDGPTFSQIWIEQLCKNEQFNERLMKLWYLYRQQGHNKVLADINSFVSAVSTAAKRDAERWRNTNVRTNGDMNNRKQDFLDRMNWRIDWLYSQWGEGDPTPLTSNEPVFTDSSQLPSDNPRMLISNGQLLIQRDGCRYTLTGQRVE